MTIAPMPSARTAMTRIVARTTDTSLIIGAATKKGLPFETQGKKTGRYNSVAAAASAAATPSAGLRRERFTRSTSCGGTEHGKLDRGFLAGALGARDFLLLVDHNFFKFVFAVFTNVFVDGHCWSAVFSFSFCYFPLIIARGCVVSMRSTQNVGKRKNGRTFQSGRLH